MHTYQFGLQQYIFQQTMFKESVSSNALQLASCVRKTQCIPARVFALIQIIKGRHDFELESGINKQHHTKFALFGFFA